MTPRELAAWVEVDLAAVRDNLRRLSKLTHARIAPVVKADAYGHGAVAVARCLKAEEVELLIVARPSEAITLRDAGVEGRILVLTPPDPGNWQRLVENRLEVSCATPESLDFLTSVTPTADDPMRVHLKLNTGMNRLGLPPEMTLDALQRLDAAKAATPVAICSHLADADLPESPRTRQQAARFARVLENLPQRYRQLETHLANSAGLLRHNLDRYSFVRPGLAVYGYDPNQEADLRPAMSVHARILQIRDLGPGERVGYGGLWTAPARCRVGVIGVGYGDGYAWHQAGSPELLTTHGRRPLVGAVSMDLLAFEIAEADQAKVGDRVTLLGELGGEKIDAHDLAANAETIAWEVLLRFGSRLPRVHLSAAT